MKPIARVSPTSGSRNNYAQYNMNSKLGGSNNYSGSSYSNQANSGSSYSNQTNSGSGYSNLPYYMYNSSSTGSGGNDSSSYNYSYSASNSSSYSASSYPSNSNSYGYASQSQSSSNYNQYNPIISSDTSSHFPFSYADNDFNSGKKKNRGFQPWVKRDSLKRPAPYSGGRGMNLMQKMGWKQGQGLGRAENGALEPSFPEIKMNKRGLNVADKVLKVPVSINSEGGRKLQMATIKLVTDGKNPVSILEEYCSKRKLEAPKYEAVVDEGPVHAKNFVFKVSVDGVEYTAAKGSHQKKTARMEAAKKCLIELGILSKE